MLKNMVMATIVALLVASFGVSSPDVTTRPIRLDDNGNVDIGDLRQDDAGLDITIRVDPNEMPEKKYMVLYFYVEGSDVCLNMYHNVIEHELLKKTVAKYDGGVIWTADANDLEDDTIQALVSNLGIQRVPAVFIFNTQDMSVVKGYVGYMDSLCFYRWLTNKKYQPSHEFTEEEIAVGMGPWSPPTE